MTQPIFLVSLPRAGSTWLQSLIACSDEVATASEPWVLLPLIEGVCKGRGFATYSQRTYRLAIESLRQNVPGYPVAMQSAMADFARTFYGELAGGCRYFLDKTPRYSVICNEIRELLPDSRTIILFRDPVDAAVSLATTFGGKWNTLFRYEIDFIAGIRNMCALARSGASNVLAIRYEDAVADTEGTRKAICAFLDIDPGLPEDLSVGRAKVRGLVGDPYAGPNTHRRRLSWGEVRQIRRFIERISDADLETMGYSRADQMAKLRKIACRPSARDLGSLAMKQIYKIGAAYPVDSIFQTFARGERRIIPANDKSFGLE